MRCWVSIAGLSVFLAACGGAQPPILNGTAPATVDASNMAKPHGYETLYSFKGPPDDGEQPVAGLTYHDGWFYGTTFLGGSRRSGNCDGCGVVYRVNANGSQRVIHEFGGKDGANPQSDLTYAKASNEFFGTTYSGGVNCSSSCGTIFSVTAESSENVLYSFEGRPDGSNPDGGLLNLGGETYYGTTAAGGAYNHGTVYRYQNKEVSVLHSFSGAFSDGADPVGDLVAIGSKLYGVTQGGGEHFDGTIFEIGVDGSGSDSILHSFSGKKDGKVPVGLVLLKGELYGTTSEGGAFGKGTIFKINPGTHKFKTIHDFAGYAKHDGAEPEAAPIAVNGDLYGTTRGGGRDGNGIVYQTDASGFEHVLYDFKRVPDGVAPRARLTYHQGYLYGTTTAGGVHRDGTVFRLKL